MDNNTGSNKGRGRTIVAVACLVIGIVAGIWFDRNFQVVPKGDSTAPEQPTQSVAQQGGFTVPQASNQSGAMGITDTPDYEPPLDMADATEEADYSDFGGEGPFTYRFHPGQNQRYALSARMSGTGIDMGESSDVDMEMQSYLNMYTKSVDERGVADLNLAFGETKMEGDFMESPFAMLLNQQIAQAFLGSKDVFSAQGGAEASPQAQYLQSSFDMQVAPNGKVLDVSGFDGIQGLLAEMPFHSGPEFPMSELPDNYSWTSSFAMPIPGMGAPLMAQIHNVFTGYATLNGRNCAVIEQTISSAGTRGAISSGQTFNNALEQFDLSNLDLNGRSRVYFDVDNGTMAANEMSLDVNLDVSQMLGPAGPMIQNLFGQMGELVQDLPEFEGSGKEEDLLNLSMHVDSTLQLVE